LTWKAGPIAATVYLLLIFTRGILPVGITLLTKWLLDAIQFIDRKPPVASPLMLVVGIGTLGVAIAVIPYIVAYLQSRLRRGVTLLVQDRLYSSVNRFDGMANFENPAFLDRLRMAQQAATMAPDQVANSIFGMVQSTITVVSFLGLLWYISPLMTVITVLAAVPLLFIQLSISRQQSTMMWKFSPRSRRQLFYQMLMLDLAAVKEVRLFGLGGFLLGRMRRETIEINAAEDRLDRKVMTSQGPLAALGSVVAAGGLVWMVGATLNGEFTIGDVSAFIAAVAGVQTALSSIVSGATQGYQALLLFGHYVDVSEMQSELPAAPDGRSVPPLQNAITVEDVWFRYTDEGPWVLKGVSAVIPFGRSLALVGLNGAGKSTLVKLLCRFYDPTRGSIKWDGVDIREVDVATLRHRISAVFQDYMSYDLSAAENIGVGDLEHLHDSDRIRTAAAEAGVDGFVSKMPRGYDTMLSRIFFQGEDNDDPEQGMTLSGGQWQRIALARAMMRAGRDLLILDEPSAGLDAASEQAVHDRLREYRTGATSVLISHRLGTVRRADRIMVLQSGQITEDGTHDELMAAGGEYARLFNIQAASYIDGKMEVTSHG
jgi:ATP-binding cassette subfamily B protein